MFLTNFKAPNLVSYMMLPSYTVGNTCSVVAKICWCSNYVQGNVDTSKSTTVDVQNGMRALLSSILFNLLYIIIQIWIYLGRIDFYMIFLNTLSPWRWTSTKRGLMRAYGIIEFRKRLPSTSHMGPGTKIVQIWLYMRYYEQHWKG